MNSLPQLISLPVNYVVFFTHYTGRFETPTYLSKLFEELINTETTGEPLYANDTLWGNGLHLLSAKYREKVATENRELVVAENLSNKILTDTEVDSIQKALQSTLPHKVDGIIVFRVESLPEAFHLYKVLEDVDYCRLFEIGNFEHIRADIGGIAVISVDSESG